MKSKNIPSTGNQYQVNEADEVWRRAHQDSAGRWKRRRKLKHIMIAGTAKVLIRRPSQAYLLVSVARLRQEAFGVPVADKVAVKAARLVEPVDSVEAAAFDSDKRFTKAVARARANKFPSFKFEGAEYPVAAA